MMKEFFLGCNLDAFVCENLKSKNLVEVESGDKIWIDILAHSLDKSLINLKNKNV